jgi:hypothetical protein
MVLCVGGSVVGRYTDRAESESGIVRVMRVTFTRTGQRCYAIAADRGRGPVLCMPVAPGYDPGSRTT